MKKLTILFVLAITLFMLAGCGDTAPVPTVEPTAVPTETPTQASTEAPTEIPVEVTEEITQPEIPAMDLVGVWQRTHTEAEGDRMQNNNATVTISGTDADSLAFSFEDWETPNFNAEEAALQICQGQLFTDCGNDTWYAEAASGSYSYCVTILEDNTLLLQLTFDFDGQPMVSTQWFARSK